MQCNTSLAGRLARPLGFTKGNDSAGGEQDRDPASLEGGGERQTRAGSEGESERKEMDAKESKKRRRRSRGQSERERHARKSMLCPPGM